VVRSCVITRLRRKERTCRVAWACQSGPQEYPFPHPVQFIVVLSVTSPGRCTQGRISFLSAVFFFCFAFLHRVWRGVCLVATDMLLHYYYCYSSFLCVVVVAPAASRCGEMTSPDHAPSSCFFRLRGEGGAVRTESDTPLFPFSLVFASFFFVVLLPVHFDLPPAFFFFLTHTPTAEATSSFAVRIFTA
jgi:hypothetical protein